MAKRIEEDNICPISLEEDNICPISLEKIEENEYYMTCRRCNKHFKLEQLKQWLDCNNSCPLCRSEWLNSENSRYKVYKNCKPKKDTLMSLLYSGLKVIKQTVNNIFNLVGWINNNIKIGKYDDLIKKYQSKNDPYLELSYMFGKAIIKYYFNKKK